MRQKESFRSVMDKLRLNPQRSTFLFLTTITLKANTPPLTAFRQHFATISGQDNPASDQLETMKKLQSAAVHTAQAYFSRFVNAYICERNQVGFGCVCRGGSALHCYSYLPILL